MSEELNEVVANEPEVLADVMTAVMHDDNEPVVSTKRRRMSFRTSNKKMEPKNGQIHFWLKEWYPFN